MIAILVGMKCSLIWILVCVSLMTADIEHLPVLVGHLYTFFRETAIQTLCLFFNWVVYLFVVEL